MRVSERHQRLETGALKVVRCSVVLGGWPDEADVCEAYPERGLWREAYRWIDGMENEFVVGHDCVGCRLTPRVSRAVLWRRLDAIVRRAIIWIE